MKIRYPNITGKTDADRMQQLLSWLRQLVDELNIVLSRLEEHNT